MNWTNEQKEILNLENNLCGKHIVNACPGSGKTTCVSERIVRQFKVYNKKHGGLAILSYTNTAIDEIKTYYKSRTNNKIIYPNFIGTFDSFINKYIFKPFNNLVMPNNNGIEMVGLPYKEWDSPNFYDNSDDITYDINGDYEFLDKSIKDKEKSKEYKYKFNKNGLVIQQDINYYSYLILEKHHNIAQILVKKFPFFIIDEAQDLTKIQMKIIEFLIENGLNNIFLIGDPNQVIYEWNQAKPDLFISKYKEWENKHTLSYSLRCSSNITKYLSKLTLNDIKSNNDCGYKPSIFQYDKGTVDSFIQFCKNKNIIINPENVAILFRNRKSLKQYFNESNIYEVSNIFKDEESKYNNIKCKNLPPLNKIKNYSKNIIRGIIHYKQNNFIDAFKEFQDAYIKICFDEYYKIQTKVKYLVRKESLFQHRITIFKFMDNILSNVDNEKYVDDWIIQFNESFDEIEEFGIDNFYITGIKTRYNGIKLNNVLKWDDLIYNNTENDKIFFNTIHSAKGKTFQAVLLVLNNNTSEGKYTNLFKNKKLEDSEELRILYVGMSRSKEILNIAVCTDETDEINEWNNFFNSSLDDYF